MILLPSPGEKTGADSLRGRVFINTASFLSNNRVVNSFVYKMSIFTIGSRGCFIL
jgi:hypothetical protein